MTAADSDNPASVDALTQRADALGRAAWGDEWRPERRVFAPGRVELLGNHLDYNGGMVLAGAIDRGVLAASSPGAETGTVAITFADPHDGRTVTETVDVAGLDGFQRQEPPASTTDYLRGAIAAVMAAGHRPRSGLRLAIAGDVPVGLGLSSSAALDVALVRQLLPEPAGDRDTILMTQAAENRAGVACGTMDQATSVAGGVIRYDAGAVAFERLSPDLGPYAFLVISSGVVHRLGESVYPTRVREMAALRETAARAFDVDAPEPITTISPEQVEHLEREGLIDATIAGRAHHLVTESARVNAGYEALAALDWVRFGELMTASGRSSATDYDVSHPQVEELVALMLGAPGVLGARMMGGGGGGSVLALARAGSADEIRRVADERYFAPHGLADLHDRFLVCAFGPGARDV